MATKDPTGKRFGDESYSRAVTKRGTTNANRTFPSVEEDVGKSVKEDVGRIKKGIAPASNQGATRMSPQAAGGRALTRMGGRAGYAGYAFMAGKSAGDELVDAYIKRLSEGKVKLSAEAKKRLQEEEDFQSVQRALRAVDQEREDEKKMRKGGAVAKKMAKGGAVKKTPMKRK